jgi:hypothetical protein
VSSTPTAAMLVVVRVKTSGDKAKPTGGVEQPGYDLRVSAERRG